MFQALARSPPQKCRTVHISLKTIISECPYFHSVAQNLVLKLTNVSRLGTSGLSDLTNVSGFGTLAPQKCRTVHRCANRWLKNTQCHMGGFQLRGVSPEASDPLVRLGSIGKVRGGGCTHCLRGGLEPSDVRGRKRSVLSKSSSSKI